MLTVPGSGRACINAVQTRHRILVQQLLSRRRARRLTALAVVLALTGCGSTAAGTGGTSTVAATAGLYDTSSVHDIQVTFDQNDYDDLIAAYQETGEKVWIEATVVIDGATYRQVGMRLKGNSSLGGLGGRGPRGAGGPVNFEVGDGDVATPPGGGECAIVIGSPPTDADGQVDIIGGGGVDSASPESLPWLIRLDKFIEDQRHAGVAEFVVRSNNSETALNEAVALGLLSAAGLATQKATSVRFAVNGSDPSLRLVIESPDEQWVAEQFDEPSADEIGQLYKAEATGDWQYRGDDEAEYEEVWDQEAGEDDLAPLTEFLKFVNDSTDEEFAAGLAERLDVEAFARYLAIEDLMGNFDDIEGPGNNSYLYFDPDTGVATVVAWDHNLAFGGMGGRGGDGPTIIGPGGDLPTGVPDPADLPEGCEFPSDMQPGDVPFERPGGGEGPAMMGSNILVERFNAVPEFAALYDAAFATLQAELFDDGTAEALLSEWTDLLTEHAGDVVSAETIKTEADQVRDAFPTT
jgi:spore coat protein CotH